MGKGLITIKVNNRNGPVVGNVMVKDDYQLMLVTDGGKVIRTPVSGVSELGRNTQGVRIIRTDEDEKVVAIARIVDPDEDDAGEEAEALPPEDDAPEDNALEEEALEEEALEEEGAEDESPEED